MRYSVSFRARPNHRSGFTLIEIMIVMVMIAIVAGIALPKMQVTQYKVDGAMRVAQATLQQAERGAVQRQMEVAVSFDTAKKRIRVHYDFNSNDAIDSGEEVMWKPLEEGNRFATPPRGVSMSAGSFIVGNAISTSPDGYPTVYYHRDGAASTNYELFIRSSSNSVDDFRALVVTQATGRVDLFRYGAGAWQRAGM
jgi:prepilin-type N-terminal cleavage/methylation domain-containing protein